MSAKMFAFIKSIGIFDLHKLTYSCECNNSKI